MSEISLVVNGRKVKGEVGDTILQVCERSGIDVPTLCHFKGLDDVGTCRMCLVEVQGARALATACTSPAENGMTVQTETEPIRALRRANLELLLSERNHYCMFCESSGDCELQALAYRYGIDSVRYPFLFPHLELDSSHPHLVLDHNRCVLCRRCVRACSQLVANHTLGIRNRGSDTMLNIDGGDPLGGSSCVSCGTCVQVCPTGALFDRRSAYRGRKADCTITESTCLGCSLGCGVELVARGRQVLRVDGNPSSPVNEGLLCQRGRYESLANHRERVLTPLIRRGERLEPGGWIEALDLVWSRFREAARLHGPEAVAGVASARIGNESLQALRLFFRDALGSQNVGAIGAAAATPSGLESATLSELRQADLILLAGDQIGAHHQVLEFFVGQAVEQGKTTVVLVGSASDRLARRASVHLTLERPTASAIMEALLQDSGTGRSLIARARRPVFVLDAAVGMVPPGLATIPLQVEAGWPRLLLLGQKANSSGAQLAGMAASLPARTIPSATFVLAGDDLDLPEQVPPYLKAAAFLVVQSSYRSDLTESARVVLPAPTWIEKSGTIINSQGQRAALRPAVQIPGDVKDEVDVLETLARAT